MPQKKSKRKPYFYGKVKQAVHANANEFAVGDEVCAKSCGKHRELQGRIISLVHGNGGKGRVYANVLCDDGSTRREPLGRLRKLKRKENDN